jgi:acyl-CoA thioesterase FadM
MEMAYVMEDSSTGELLADGTSVLVAYDYRNRQSVPISDGWRIIISTFDNLPVVMNE